MPSDHKRFLTCKIAAAGNYTFSRRQLRAQLRVEALTALPPGVPRPQLAGQIEASADASGQIVVTDVRLTAAPGTYVVVVSLPDYPSVSLQTSTVQMQHQRIIPHVRLWASWHNSGPSVY